MSCGGGRVLIISLVETDRPILPVKEYTNKTTSSSQTQQQENVSDYDDDLVDLFKLVV